MIYSMNDLKDHISDFLISSKFQPADEYFKQFGDVDVIEQEDLLLFNYNHFAQFKNRWNWFELNSRGLIINKFTGEIVARPFPKFFNWGERTNDTKIREVTEKMDGCFKYDTPIQCWDGSTIKIGDIVKHNLSPILMGVDKNNNVVPCEILDRFDNGTKNNWLAITVDCPVSKKSGSGSYPNTIKITDNHHIYVNNKYIAASGAKTGDTISTFEYTPAHSVINFIKAGLLGDGSIVKAFNSYKYQESHKKEHKEYSDFIQWCLGDCAIAPRTTISGYGTQMIQNSSRAYKIFNELRKEWYPNGTKVIPMDLSWINDFTVAKWYMDDGSLCHDKNQKDRAVFATNCFNRQDVERLANKLTELYNIECVVFNNKGWNIRVNSGKFNSIKTFWERISCYIVPCMRYKLPEQYRNDIVFYGYYEGKQETVLRTAKILNIQKISPSKINFPSGRKGFDIKTSTGNYFAKGMLVHNSLGILYRHNGQHKVATRGSFNSEQAIWATEFLNKNYDLTALPVAYTLLFEIIYPDNRIVVNYGRYEDLVLIGAIDRFYGRDLYYQECKVIADEFGFAQPLTYTFESIREALLAAHDISANEEGWVVRFENGERLKIKGEAYKKAHKLLSNITFNRVLEAVAEGQYDNMISGIPDEFLDEVKAHKKTIDDHINDVVKKVNYYMPLAPTETRKDFALYVKAECPELLNYMFAAYDGRDYISLIYKNIKE